MPRDPRHDILFEPLAIGPVIARNRFYQVPHCNGMGHQHPHAHAAMRGMKAEGGWAVIATEECEIHPSGDVSPYVEARNWDDHDIPALAMMAEAVHRHGSLAAIELTHNGASASNFYSREPLLAPSPMMSRYYPIQARAMDREDIRNYRRWHREAALRAKRAGFDIVYVYAGHDLNLALHFLQAWRNRRSDEYGGSFVNRLRLLKELILDAKEAVGDRCAIAVRFGIEEMRGPDGIAHDGEGREVIAHLAELPDLWDINLSDWKYDSQTSRFAEEGYQEAYFAEVKTLTTKPVVGVGRYTSPDRMAMLIKKGILDMIGAARPSIADPFLPRKIEEGRSEDIRECIGCNICVTGDYTMSPIRCTQNPTMGEEWRKSWHPEIVPAKTSDGEILIVGAGPAGLEAARALGQRGYRVHLAEARGEAGGRVAAESRLPGLAAWGRVRDYRLHQIGKMANVELYFDSRLDAAAIREFGFAHVALATGADWRKDGIGRSHADPIPGLAEGIAFSPDDIMADRLPERGPVLVYDDEHFYMAGLLAEKLRRAGYEVIYATGDNSASSWTTHTLEHGFVNRRLRDLGIAVLTDRDLVAFSGGLAQLVDLYSGRREEIVCNAIVPVTSRLPRDEIYRELKADAGALAAAGITSLAIIGDGLAPGFIAHAIYAGHRYAREFDAGPLPEIPFRRVLPLLTTP